MAPGDRNYWSPSAREESRAAGGGPVAPDEQGKRDPEPGRSEALLGARRRIETAFSHPIEGLDLRRVRARDLWHLEHRPVRKVLAPMAAGWLIAPAGRRCDTRRWSLSISHTVCIPSPTLASSTSRSPDRVSYPDCVQHDNHYV